MQRAWWVGLLSILLALAPARGLAQSEAELSQARERFAEGVRLLNRERWAAAAERFREVMRVRATPQVKYNLGLALSHMEEEDVAQSRRLLREAAADETLDGRSRRGAERRLEQIGPGPEAEVVVPEAEPAGDESSYLNRPFTGQRPFTLEAHAGFSFFGVGFLAGARFGIPLVNNLIPSINNALYLNFGLDYYYVRNVGRIYGSGFGIPLALHWEFYFHPQWSGFIELGGQFFVHPLAFDNQRFDVYEAGLWFLAVIGASWHVHENFAITLRLGTPYTSLAATFLF
jgi:hypothetical protein